MLNTTAFAPIASQDRLFPMARFGDDRPSLPAMSEKEGKGEMQ